MKIRPMIFRLVSGSVTSANSVKNRSAASMTTSLMPVAAT